MGGKVRATFILVLIFFATIPYSAFAEDYEESISTLKQRVYESERALREVSKSVSSNRKDAIAFYQEIDKTIEKFNQKIEALERRVSVLESRQKEIEELKSRIEDLEMQIQQLKRKDTVAKKDSQKGRGLLYLARNSQVGTKPTGCGCCEQAPATTESEKRSLRLSDFLRKSQTDVELTSLERASRDDDADRRPRIEYAADTCIVETRPVPVRATRYYTSQYDDPEETDGSAIRAVVGILSVGALVFCLQSHITR